MVNKFSNSNNLIGGMMLFYVPLITKSHHKVFRYPFKILSVIPLIIFNIFY